MWIARNEDNNLYCFINKPKRYQSAGVDWWATRKGHFAKLKVGLFPEVTWKSEPVWKRLIHPKWIQA